MEHDNFKWVIDVAFLVIALSGAVASYMKSVSDIRHEIQEAIAKLADKLREEARAIYASKEEFSFLRENLTEIKISLKEIMAKVEIRNNKLN